MDRFRYSILLLLTDGRKTNTPVLKSGHNISRIVKTAQKFQRVNHFPGMVNIYRKGHLARVMAGMQSLSSGYYDFFPKTWLLPGDYILVQSYFASNPGSVLIVKPSCGAQGKGISLVMNAESIHPDQDSVVQTYVSSPFLLNGYKFDLRIYVLVLSCDPLRIYIFDEGLVRVCTTKYAQPNQYNIEIPFMHLTNYSVNKENPSFVQNNEEDNDDAKKQSLGWLWAHLSKLGHDTIAIWRGISDIIVKTLISIQPMLASSYDACKADPDNQSPFTCFEVLGFDILLTDKLEPLLLEVNHTPSFRTDSSLDMKIKCALITDTLRLLNVSAENRIKHQRFLAHKSQIRLYGEVFEEQKREPGVSKEASTICQWAAFIMHERANIRRFRLIYPTDEYINQPTKGKQDLYNHLLDLSSTLYYVGLGEQRLADTSSVRNKVNHYVTSLQAINMSGNDMLPSRILVVEDSVLQLRILMRELEGLGFNVDSAVTGREARKKLAHLPCRYDIVLVDIMIPGIDGIETIRHCREKLNMTIPIIALSSANDIDRAELDEAGATAFFVKPVKAMTMMDFVYSQSDKRTQKLRLLKPQSCCDSPQALMPSTSSPLARGRKTLVSYAKLSCEPDGENEGLVHIWIDGKTATDNSISKFAHSMNVVVPSAPQPQWPRSADECKPDILELTFLQHIRLQRLFIINEHGGH